jgi:hypothetical protein
VTDFTRGESEAILALREILIAQVAVRRELGSYWALDVSGLFRLQREDKALEEIRAEIARADPRPSNDPRLVPRLCESPVPFHGYLFSTLLSSADSRNMALGRPQLRGTGARYDFVLTKGGTMFFKDASSRDLPRTDEEFLSAGWSEVKRES